MEEIGYWGKRIWRGVSMEGGVIGRGLWKE